MPTLTATVSSDARLDRMVEVSASVQIGPPGLHGGLNKPYGRSTTALLDARGNPPNVAMLGFPLPLETRVGSQGRSLALLKVNVYLKQDRGDGQVPRYSYTHLESRGVYGVMNYWEWFYFLLTAVHGEQYAVNWTLPDGTLTPATPVDAEVYFPPLPDPERQHSNSAMTASEHARRVILTDRQHGEQSIFFRRKTIGAVCQCYNDSTGEGLRDCPLCFGVGFEGGFDIYPRILIRFIPAGAKLNLGEMGIMVDTTPRTWTMAVPEITDRDMFVRTMPDGRLRAYEIHNVTRKPLEGPSAVPIIQEFSLKQMQSDEPIYRAMDLLLPASYRPVETGREPGLPRRY